MDESDEGGSEHVENRQTDHAGHKLFQMQEGQHRQRQDAGSRAEDGIADKGRKCDRSEEEQDRQQTDAPALAAGLSFHDIPEIVRPRRLAQEPDQPESRRLEHILREDANLLQEPLTEVPDVPDHSDVECRPDVRHRQHEDHSGADEPSSGAPAQRVGKEVGTGNAGHASQSEAHQTDADAAGEAAAIGTLAEPLARLTQSHVDDGGNEQQSVGDAAKHSRIVFSHLVHSPYGKRFSVDRRG
ncbi:MAG: hypothetical protein BWY75_02038 [bacterium ADurb.Bin425]|nr:MAG: hypothetical protein BWY75_02038 [bacterium ADurb.Bin425]